jgi:hypothetical protein
MFSPNILLLIFSIVAISAVVIILPGIVLAHKDSLQDSGVSAMRRQRAIKVADV